jgi:hypothetical protein
MWAIFLTVDEKPGWDPRPCCEQRRGLGYAAGVGAGAGCVASAFGFAGLGFFAGAASGFTISTRLAVLQLATPFLKSYKHAPITALGFRLLKPSLATFCSISLAVKPCGLSASV